MPTADAPPREDSTTPPLLRVTDLTIAFPRSGPDHTGRSPTDPMHWTPVVRDVSFSVRTGEMVALVGESGSGKTMTGLSILGLLPVGGVVRQGRMAFQGSAGTIDLRSLDEAGWRRVRGRRIAMVFQDPATALNPLLSIGRQLIEALRTHGHARRAARARATALLEQVAMPDPEDRLSAYPHQLSGGQRQRALLALALTGDPALLIADEPTASLDVTLQRQMLHLLDQLRRDRGMAVLLVTHDLAAVARFSDRMLVMYAGRLVEQGPTAAVEQAPAHPYTRALIDARPRLGSARREDQLAGVPDAVAVPPPTGCAFAPRCPAVVDRCHHETPPEVPLADDRRSRCHRVDDLVEPASTTRTNNPGGSAPDA